MKRIKKSKIDSIKSVVSSNEKDLLSEEKRTEIDSISEVLCNYKKIFDTAPIAISITNKFGKPEFFNKFFIKTFGYTLEDIPNSETWFKKAYPDKKYRSKVIAAWTRAVKYRNKKNNEIRSFSITCKSGINKDVLFRLSELDSNRLLIILEDISDRIQIESALKENEQKFRKILENISLIGLILDNNGRIVFCNSYLLELTGYNKNEIINKNWFNIFIPFEIRKKLKDSFSNSVSVNNFKTHYENSILTKSGEQKYISWSNLYIRNELNEKISIVSLGQDITEKKKSEIDFKIRDDRFDTFISQTTDAVNCWEFDKKNNINSTIKKQLENILSSRLVECNDNFAKLYGHQSAKEVLGISFSDLVRNDKTSKIQLYKKFIENNYQIENEELLETQKNGHKKYLLYNVHGIVEHGYLFRIWVNIRNITEIKNAENALKESENRFKSLFENATVGIYRTTPSGKILMANPAIIKMLGYRSYEEFSSTNVVTSGYVNNSDRKYFKKIMRDFGEIKGFECKWWKKDKSKVYIRESAIAFKNNSEKIQYYEGMVEDITDKKKAESDLLKNELKYQTLFNLTPSGIILTDSKGNIVNANPAFCNSLGYNPSEIINKNVRVIAAPENYNEIENNLKFLNEGKILRHTIRNVTKSGNFRYMELHEIKIQLNENEHAILGVSNDITERKNFEEELIKAKEKAESSDKLKTEFLAQISHEIRTPINTILSFTSFLHDELKESELDEMNNIFDIIHNAGNRITRTIDMILNMSELQTGTYVPSHKQIDLYEKIVKPISLGFSRIADSKQLKFITESKTSNNKIIGDEYTLNQIFENLINNAFKYTITGKIKITVGRNKKNKLYAKITDTGIGISKEFLSVIFEPFSQEEQGYTRKFEGNGLGLALVKNYCKLNNAEIGVKSKKGVGTAFTVIFN